ncbi:MAG: CoA pyrophosphatase [Rhizobiales bacterium]|nr:CoA pyrophosphatase [Hyphomicrobiales bacterium]
MTAAFTTPDVLARAARSLLREPPPSWDASDDDMNVKARMIPDGIKPKHAAVLVGLISRGDELNVLLTQRTAHLSKHAGQIAFPGGRLDEGETPLAAALRETFEETGIEPSFVEPLGYLDGYLTVTGYLVNPVVALLKEGYRLAPHDHEVADIFEVPLSFLLTETNRETHTREWQGLTRRYYAYPFGERYIWGATAGMIKNLGDRLYGTAPQTA